MRVGDIVPRDAALRLPQAWPPVLVFGALGIFLLAATASLFIAGPQIQVDEGSYLLTAATLAGKFGATEVNGYYSGYSLLLVPAMLFSADPTRIYHAVLVTNALLVATTPFALFRLTHRLFPAVAPKWHAATALAATCYASLLLLTQHAMSESALVPLYAWLLATGVEAALTARKSSALACGLFAGALFLVHPRGGLMAAAVLAVLTVPCLVRPKLRVAIAMMWIGALCLGALHAPIEHLAWKSASLGSSYSAGHVFRRLLRPGSWHWVAFNAFGALSEAVVSSLGVVVLAFVGLGAELVTAWRGDRRASWPRIAAILAIAAGFAVALLMSAMFFIPPQRADHIAYGRYALPATVPLLSIGLLRFSLDLRSRRRAAVLAMTAGLVSIVVMGLAFRHLPVTMTSAWNYVNLPILYVMQHATSMLESLRNGWLAIGVCFVACGGALYLVACVSRAAGIAVFIALNLVAAAIGWHDVAWAGARMVDAHRNVVAAADAFESVTGAPLCVDFSDELDADPWFAIDMSWHLLNAQLDTIRHDARPCTRASIDVVDATVLAHADRIIAIEVRRPLMQGYIALIVEPGPALDAWKAKMPPAQLGGLTPLPDGDRRARVEVTSAPATRLRIGETLGLDVRVTNEGEHASWPADDGAPYPIRLGARTFIAGSDQAVGEYRTPLEAPLAPGQSATMHIDVGPFAEVGTYTVTVGVVQDLVAWLDDMQDIRVQVTDR